MRIRTLEKGELNPELWRVSDPPERLEVQGTDRALDLLRELPERGLAIVGTRDPLPALASRVRGWLLDLAGASLVVVSGFARGVDGAAHEGALAAGLPTIAILGAPLDVDYPREHAELRRRILAADGLLVSEYPAGRAHLRTDFLLRNRLIAGWSRATLVVQARARSGALNTAAWAREHDRTCFALPSAPGDPAYAGNQWLLDEAHAVPFWGAHSLGQVWLELATRGKPGAVRARRSHYRAALACAGDSDEQRLASEIARAAVGGRGAAVERLFDWSAEQGWSSGRFYAALDSAMRRGRVIERSGVLLPGSNS